MTVRGGSPAVQDLAVHQHRRCTSRFQQRVIAFANNTFGEATGHELSG
eukprot:COSAG05_NODE_10936_length_538_cov_1.168565_1_plen_47_part_01